MADIIHLLPDAIANQIAAGEVVQRPASAVKELLENSVDAGSTRIQLIVKEAGKTLIQVIDDGKGMSATDARMSFERHATSKIKSAEDLFKIKTMGFRGEALASIAAVAQVELRTRQPDKEVGTAIYIESSMVKRQEPVAVPVGTSIAVKNLFYNIPARRNFLKSNPVELRHVLDEFQRIALSNPEVAFSFHQNDIETYNLEASKLSQRIVGLFGKNYREQLIPCKEDTPHMEIHGYVGKPDFAKKTRGEQFFFINNRYIRHNYLNHAVATAYSGLIAADQFPFYVLFITIDPSHVDVNVHPTKTEVKFDDERTIYGTVLSAVRQALGMHHVMPSLDFSADVNFSAIAQTLLHTGKDQVATRRESDYGSFKTVDPRLERNLSNWETLFQKAKIESTPSEYIQPSIEETTSRQRAITVESAANSIGDQSLDDYQQSTSAPWQLHQRYILKQVKSGLMVMDQQYVHERILFEKFMLRTQNKKAAIQQSLFPAQVELNPADMALVMEVEHEIKALGFSFEAFGKNTIVINGTPADVAAVNEKELFEGLLEQYKWNKKELTLGANENLVRSLAKRSAMKPGHKLNQRELATLIDQLFECSQPNYTPDGKPTFIILELDKFDTFFNRK